MKYLKKSTLDSVSFLDAFSPFLPSDTTHISKLLSFCLRCVEEFFNYLRGAIANTNWCRQLVSSRIPGTSQKINSKRVKKVFTVNELIANQRQVTDQPPLIKASTRINHYDADGQNWTDYGNRDQLAGKSILCIGGRATLYPQYRHLVEASGGNFLAFHGKPIDGIDKLYGLLALTDMVICPVDCVNHDTFYIVKHYCKHANKPWALLDRSGVATFRKGIAVLASMATTT